MSIVDQIEDATAVVFLNNRYHDPVLGRFITVDPIVASTRDAYGYGNNNPVRYSHPWGLDPDDQGPCGGYSTSQGCSKAVVGAYNVAAASSGVAMPEDRDDYAKQVARLKRSFNAVTAPLYVNPLLDPAVISEIGKLGPAALGVPGSASTGGVCGGATIRLGGAASGSLCFGATGGKGAWGSATVEVSGQVAAGLTVDGGTMASNATVPEQMSGKSVCGGYGFSSLGGASVVACVGVNDNLELPQLGPDEGNHSGGWLSLGEG